MAELPEQNMQVAVVLKHQEASRHRAVTYEGSLY